jgi:F0F1-type ATP synthase delta subunit
MWIQLIVMQLVVFVVIVIVLKKILLNDTLSAVARLRQVEDDVRKKEETVRREIEEHEREFQARSAEAREKMAREKETSEKELARLRDSMISEAKRESDRIVSEAQLNKERLRREIFEEMTAAALDCSGQIYEMVFSEKIGAAINRQFIDELIEGLEELDESSVTLEGEGAEFTSSHPLETDQKRRIEAILLKKFGREIKVSEKVSPNLLAGLIIRIGGLEIDGSLLSRFKEAAEEVKRKKKT